MNPLTDVTEPDYNQCLTLLRNCVAERGYYHIYSNPVPKETYGYEGPACLYVHGDQPGCIIGMMLYKHGVPISTLANKDLMSAVATMWRPLFGTTLTTSTKKWALLTHVQVGQDSFEPWGLALDKAIEKAADYELV